MKNSGVEWIGEIPEDWEVRKIKNNATVFAGYPFDSNKFSTQKGFPLIRIRDITSGNIETFFDGDFDSSYIIKKDDLIIGMDGDFNLRWWNNQDALLNQRCCKIETNEVINKRFLFYCIPYDLQNINNLAYSTTVKHLSNSDILNISIPLPPKSTQQRIASYLDKKCNKIEETIQNQQQVIEKLKAYKQSLITEAVTGKIKIKNGKVCGEYESYKDSGVEWIGKIPSEWEVKKLKFSSQIMRGLFSHRPRNDPDYYDGVFPFIQTGEVARAVKYITTYSQTLNELGFSVSREFPAGTVLLTIAANVGDVAILDFNACFPDSVIGFYPKENVSKIFMFYVLKSMKEQFMRNAIISTQMNLNINIVKEEFIPLPSLAEQKEIVKFLEKKSDYIDTAIEQKQNLIEKLTEYKKSLIYECVTGKKEI